MRYLPHTLLTLLLAGCASHEVAPLTSGNAVIGSDADEIKIFEESTRAHQELRDKGLILNDPEITAYLNAVLERIKPDDLPDDLTITVAAVRDPVVNAYAFPDGGIYMNIGLLARLGNEAQLAHITAHELAHVVERHSLEGYKDRRDKIVAAHITDLFLFGTSIAYIPYIASISSYSRSQEEEADKLAIEWMSAAGYPLSSAAGLFAVLQEVKVGEAAVNSMYSSHPRNSARARYTREYIETHDLATNPQASAGEDTFRPIRAALTLQTITLQLNNKHYELARDTAVRALHHDPENPWLYYYRGEAWRLMGDDPAGAAREHAWLYDKALDDELTESMRARRDEFYAAAITAYETALARDAGFAKAHRGLGLVAWAQGNRALCKDQLTRYLASPDPIGDRRYITTVLRKLDSAQ
jgi:hypothetical protein